MAGRAFDFTVLTMDRLVYRDRVYGVIVPAALGSMGVLPGHIPYLATLGAGDVFVKGESFDEPRRIARVEGGFVEVERGRVTVFADTATGGEAVRGEE